MSPITCTIKVCYGSYFYVLKHCPKNNSSISFYSFFFWRIVHLYARNWIMWTFLVPAKKTSIWGCSKNAALSHHIISTSGEPALHVGIWWQRDLRAPPFCFGGGDCRFLTAVTPPSHWKSRCSCKKRSRHCNTYMPFYEKLPNWQ